MRSWDIASVRHDPGPPYNLEGYGGLPVDEWPIYRFFHRYVQGRPEQAVQDFADWYEVQYGRYGDIPKSRGGLKGGSLDRLILRNASEGISAQESFVIRAQQRFELLMSIRDNGYRPVMKSPVIGLRRVGGRELFILNGHHRVAALAALGMQQVPSLLERATIFDVVRSRQ